MPKMAFGVAKNVHRTFKETDKENNLKKQEEVPFFAAEKSQEMTGQEAGKPVYQSPPALKPVKDCLNPNQQAISSRFTTLTDVWNRSGITPLFSKSLANLTGFEQSDLLKGLDTYPDAVIINAVGNYRKVRDSPDQFDPGGCTKYTFISFLTKGVERYRDESKPFEEFRKRGNGPPPLRDRAQGTKISLE